MQHKEIASTRHYAIYAQYDYQVKVVLPMLCPAIARLEGGGINHCYDNSETTIFFN